MAAGGVDVLRRRDSRFPCKEFGYDDSGSGQNRFYGRAEDRKVTRFSSANDGEASKIEDMDLARLPHEKKRKFSPIIWDKEEKNVTVSSKKRVAAITPPHPPSRSRSPSRVLDSVSDGKFSKSDVFESDNQVEGEEVSAVEAAVVDQCSDPRPKLQDEMEKEEIVLARTISMSRWASVEDSPQRMSDGECTPYTGRSSSTESGEFEREGSSGVRATMSSSDDEDCYVGSGSGGKCSGKVLSDGSCEDAGTNQVDYDCDVDGEDSQIDEPTISSHQHVNMLQSCRSVFEYEKLNKINEGTYGVVYKARDKKSGEIVALKKVKMDVTKDDYGFPLSSLREINILSSFSHPSIVDVKEVAMDNDVGVYMVMEYMEHDLKGLMEKMKEPFSIGEVKWLMLQLLEGVNYLHDNWVLHRDLKTSNLLLNKDGKLKICDFGMSRQYGSPLKPYTSLVVTLWYRAPEILLGTKEYSTAVDMWSVGCIMGELVAKCPLFRGKNEVEQLDKIFRTLGTPNETIWPGFSKLPGSKAKFVKQPYNLLRKKFPPTSFIGSPVLSDLGFDLLSRLLTYDPEMRITAEEALNHKWFVEAPLPRSDFRPSLSTVQSKSRYLSSRE